MSSALENYFAKMEKKKKKTKGKLFVTTEEIAKAVEATQAEAADDTACALKSSIAFMHTEVRARARVCVCVCVCVSECDFWFLIPMMASPPSLSPWISNVATWV